MCQTEKAAPERGLRIVGISSVVWMLLEGNVTEDSVKTNAGWLGFQCTIRMMDNAMMEQRTVQMRYTRRDRILWSRYAAKTPE